MVDHLNFASSVAQRCGFECTIPPPHPTAHYHLGSELSTCTHPQSVPISPVPSTRVHFACEARALPLCVARIFSPQLKPKLFSFFEHTQHKVCQYPPFLEKADASCITLCILGSPRALLSMQALDWIIDIYAAYNLGCGVSRCARMERMHNCAQTIIKVWCGADGFAGQTSKLEGKGAVHLRANDLQKDQRSPQK